MSTKSETRKLTKSERHQKSRAYQRPFGKKRGKNRGRHRAKEIQEELESLMRCKTCDKPLPDLPNCKLTQAVVDQFLTNYEKISPCKPVHCALCKCDQCVGVGQDTLTDIETGCCTQANCECDTDAYGDLSQSFDTPSDFSVRSPPPCNLPNLQDPDYIQPSESETETEHEDEIDEILHDESNVNQNEFRIINLGHLTSIVGNITIHAALCKEAQKMAVNNQSSIILEGITQLGLAWILKARCQCGTEFSWNSSPRIDTEHSSHFEINIRAVWAQMATGGGQFKLDEQMSTMGMPGISQSSFTAIENEIGTWWREALQQEMLEAGIQERKIAEEAGIYDEDIPAIGVILDCGWSKTAHKHTYNAKAGVGVIIGQKTKRLLHIGIKQKSCLICERSESAGTQSPQHSCSANWRESSQAMEAAIFLEGFQEAERVHGVRYIRYIGDGDSNTLLKLQAEGPQWCKRILKDECANHATKCLRSNLEKLVEEYPEFKGKGMLTKTKRIQISTGARCAIKMRANQLKKKELEERKAVESLRHDINNIGFHSFGCHENCSKDFCKIKQKKENETNVQKRQENTDENPDCLDNDDDDDDDILADQAAMWADIMSEEKQDGSRSAGITPQDIDPTLLMHVNKLLNRLAEKADRLIQNNTSNLCENWMSIRCKLDGGKKINRTHRFSWYYRCYGAGLRRNLGTYWGPKTWESCTGTPASRPMWLHALNQDMNLQNHKEIKSKAHILKWSRKRKYKSYAQATTKKARLSYGPDADVQICDDVSPDELKTLCDRYMEKEVNITERQSEAVEQSTTLQSGSGVWKEERRKRLTASGFGEVCKRNPKLKVEPYVRRKLYGSFNGNQYTRHGLQQERATIIDYEAIMEKQTGSKIKVESAGLKIFRAFQGLGATSDGIVHINGIPSGLIEIKNLLKNKTITFEQYIKTTKTKFCLEIKNNKLQLNRNDNYYFQIQGQLNIYDFPWCDFVVRSTNPYQFHLERIERDKEFWSNTMLPKLKAMYLNVLLPELAVPRYRKDPGIREPKDGNWFPEGGQTDRTKRSVNKRACKT